MKDPNPQRAERLLTDSPWTMRVEATMNDPADQPDPPSSQIATTPDAGPGARPQNTRWDGQISKNRMGHLATIPVTVRWDSAAIMRRALESRHEGNPAELASASQENYVITMQGLLPSNAAKGGATLRTKSTSDVGPTVRSAEETLEWFMTNSRLLIKGQPPAQPRNVKVDQESGAVHLFFSRSDALGAHKRDVIFVTRFGSMNVQAKFRTKDMLVDGKPDL